MGVYDELLIEINNCPNGFSKGTEKMIEYISGLNRDEISELLLDIGAIPQSIKPSSSKEKLYSKVTDIVLSRCFEELNLKSEVLESRGNSADVKAVSKFHGYSLVADSKAMRLTRTAKNQKDFKIGALGDNWIGNDSTFAVLCCPLYQYPKVKSQIYEQSLNNKTCLFSWEYLKFLIDNNIKETEEKSLEPIWSVSVRLSRTITTDRSMNYFNKITESICSRVSIGTGEFEEKLKEYYDYLIERAEKEKVYIEEGLAQINSLTREEAIEILSEKGKNQLHELNTFLAQMRGES